MGDLTLKVTNRDVLGKKTRFLRRQGISPVHLFGHSVKSLALQCDTAQLKHIIAQAGTTKLINLEIDEEKHPRSVFIREIQRNAGNRDLLHVDFYQIRKKERIKVEVPIVLVGEAPALKSKGRSLMQTLDTLSIESLPDKLPPQIEVDLSSLEEVGQTVHVRDIPLSPDITLNTDPDQLVVKISEARVEVVEEAVEEEKAEVKAEAEPEQEPAD